MSASNGDKAVVWAPITSYVTVLDDKELLSIREKMKELNYYVIDLDNTFRVMVSPDFPPFVFDPMLGVYFPLRVH